MAMPTILPSGQLHPDLLKGPFVKQIAGTPVNTSEPGVKVHGNAMSERWKQAEERANQIWRENRGNAIDLSSHFSSRTVDSYDGKTVVENKGMELIVETLDPTVFTAEDANKAAASGEATHGFFYRGSDFLLRAAKEYTALGENFETTPFDAIRRVFDTPNFRAQIRFLKHGAE